MDRKALLSASIDNLTKTFGFDDGSGLETIIGNFVPESLTFRELRQWLSIVRRAFVNADWPTEYWPNWLTERTPQVTPPRLLN